MFNQAPFNSLVFNWSKTVNLQWIQDEIVFNWLSMQSNEIVSTYKNDESFPDVNFTTYNIPRRNWGGVLDKTFPSKNIEIQWYLKASTKEELNTIIDNFKKKLSQTEWNLDIKYSWIVRRTKATVVWLNIEREAYNNTFIPFTVNFKTVEPFQYELTNISVTYANRTAGFQEVVFNEWTAKTDGIFYFVFGTGLSWVSSLKITTESQEIEITNTFNDNDLLIIDWVNKEVKLNWSIIDYDGVFPELDLWNNFITFTIPWTYSVNASVLYRKQFI